MFSLTWLSLHKNGKIQNCFSATLGPVPGLPVVKRGMGSRTAYQAKGTARLHQDAEAGLLWAFSIWQIRGVRKRSSVWSAAMLGAGEGGIGTSSFKQRASRDHYVHLCWPEDENLTHLQHLRGLCCTVWPRSQMKDVWVLFPWITSMCASQYSGEGDGTDGSGASWHITSHLSQPLALKWGPGYGPTDS